MARFRMRDVRLGVVVLVAVGGLLGLVGLAGGGPGFLTQRRNVDVIFRDGQGIRAGSPVRVAGIDAGRVVAVDLQEHEGLLRARVRMAIPEELAGRLRQDVRVTVQPSLTGAPCVNIVSSGSSSVALVPGQLVLGIESSLFDPVLQQVGLGPQERDDLSHTIGQVRQTVDAAGPRLQLVLGNLQEAVAGLRETVDTVRPSVEASMGRVESITRKLDEAGVDQLVREAEALLVQSRSLVEENRPLLTATLASARDLSGQLTEFTANTSPRVQDLIVQLDGTRQRADLLLDRAGVIAQETTEILARNRANLDRTLSNVREATDHGVALVQKLRGNPFYLSPFYKPTKEDVQAQEVYDAAGTFLMAARELQDSLTKIESLRGGKAIPSMTAEEQQYYNQLFQRAWTLQSQLEQTNKQLAEGLRDSTRR